MFVTAPSPVNCGSSCVCVKPYFPYFLYEYFPSRDLLSRCPPGAVFFAVTVSHSCLSGVAIIENLASRSTSVPIITPLHVATLNS